MINLKQISSFFAYASPFLITIFFSTLTQNIWWFFASIVGMLLINFLLFKLTVRRTNVDSITIDESRLNKRYTSLLVNIHVAMLMFTLLIGVEGENSVRYPLCFFLFILTLSSTQHNYCNLLFIFFGFDLYEYDTQKGKKILIYSKQEPTEDTKKLYRINDYTFLNYGK